MRIFFDDTGSQQSDTIIIISKKESDALVSIIAGYMATKPNKRSSGYKVAVELEGRLLA